MSTLPRLNLTLHPKQGDAFASAATEILFGGAAGGGKSHLMRVAAISWCSEIAGLQVYLFRRIRDDLVKNHMEGPKGFRALLAGWVDCGFVDIVEDEIRFKWNGSKIYLCHCKNEKDRFKYQGAEMHVLLVDELTHFTEPIYRFLRNRVRMVGIRPPAKYEGLFPRILCGANPGGVGHHFVKATFVDTGLPMEINRVANAEGGMLRQFIPALLDDNPSMAEDDPGYEARLEGLGSQELVKAMRHGDWDIVEGAFFSEFDRRLHVLEPFAIPENWTRFRSADWGSAKPFSIGWWAIVPDDFAVQGRVLPRHALIRYREWYGMAPGRPNVGVKMPAEEVARGILKKEAGETVRYGVLDPATIASDGGPSIMERFVRAGVLWRPADNKRVGRMGALGGWDQVRARLKGDGDGRPMIYVFSTCRDAIRTLPVLQHDPDRPEDLDTEAEDHAADDIRYACMSRPFIRTETPPKPEPKDLTYTVDEMGRVTANMTVMEIVEAKKRKRHRDDR